MKLRMKPRLSRAGCGLAVLLMPALACEAEAQALIRPKDVAITAHVVVTSPLKPSDALIQSLRLPPGFHIAEWADGLNQPRVMAAAPNGDIYVSDSSAGTITLLRGVEHSTFKTQVRSKKDVMGLSVHDGSLFYATVHEIFAAPMKSDGTLGDERLIAANLPDVGQHNDRTIAFGPDGWLYEAVGSTCNECDEQNPESATMVRMRADGSSREIFASGLRNTIGFAWKPGTRQLYGWDDGVDWLGDEAQREELNHIEQGKKYGWPYVFGDGQLNYYRDPPPSKGTIEQWDRDSVRPELTYTAHSSGMQLVFYAGRQFPVSYGGDAFVTLHGSWNREPPSGYEVVRVHFEANNKPASITPFLSGFLRKTGDHSWARFARPFGLLQLADGSLLMGEDQNGVIYRISYEAP